MSKIHAVLLIPEEGDPMGLLADGVCGARPPTTEHGNRPLLDHLDKEDHLCSGCNTWCGYAGHPSTGGMGSYDCGDRDCGGGATVRLTTYRYGDKPRALVLAWGGEVVPEGAAWLWARTAQTNARGISHTVQDVISTSQGEEPWASAMRWLGEYGTIVLVDSEGNEIAP